MHEEHRDRMRKRFLRDGIDKFESHEVLEMLLYGVIPRRNTNDIAHNLMKHFGTLPNVLNASYAELMKVKGIGSVSAVYIMFISGVVHRYLMEMDLPSKQKTLSTKEVAKIFTSKFFNMKEEHLAVMLLNKEEKFLSCEILRKGSFGNVSISSSEIFEYASRFNSNKVIIAHNHPSGLALPSAQDLDFTMDLKHSLYLLNIYLVDHIIVGSKDTFSFAEYDMFELLEKEAKEKEELMRRYQAEEAEREKNQRIADRKREANRKRAETRKKKAEEKKKAESEKAKSAGKSKKTSVAKKTDSKKATTSSTGKTKTTNTSKSKTSSTATKRETKKSTIRKTRTSSTGRPKAASADEKPTAKKTTSRKK